MSQEKDKEDLSSGSACGDRLASLRLKYLFRPSGYAPNLVNGKEGKAEVDDPSLAEDQSENTILKTQN